MKTILSLAVVAILSMCSLQPVYASECATPRDVVRHLNSKGFTPALSGVFDGADAETVAGVVRRDNPGTPLPDAVSLVAVFYLTEADIAIAIHDDAGCVAVLFFAPARVLDLFETEIARTNI